MDDVTGQFINPANDPPSVPGEATQSQPSTVRLRPGWASTPCPSPDDPAGEHHTRALPGQIGPYEVDLVLSYGGMGVIYRAVDARLKRRVALKMVLSGAHSDPAALARFRGEAEAVALLQHPNIVQIYEVGEHDGLPFLALEFVEGKNLQQAIAERPPSPREAAELVRALAMAVEFAHQRGIIHRDLKPGNILMAADGTPKITDFGLAKLKGVQETYSRPGEVIGTPNYMSPEQADGNSEQVGPSTDVYALGAILYELLTGQPPFHGTSPVETLLRLRVNNPIRPRQLRPGLPADLETICLKCLEKDPWTRYVKAEQLAEDLRRYLEGRPIVARPARWPERVWKWSRRHPAVALMILMLAAGAATSYGVFVMQWRDMQKTHQDLQKQTAALAAMRTDLELERESVRDARRRAQDARSRADWMTYRSLVNEAEREYATANAAKARQLLDQCADNLRSWEWHYLRRRVEGSAASTAVAGGPVLAFRFATHGRDVLAARADARVARYSLGTGDEGAVVELQWNSGTRVSRMQRQCAFSPRGDRVAADCIASHPSTGEPARFLAVWDTETGTLVHSWHLKHDYAARRIDFSPDGKRLLLVTAEWKLNHGRDVWSRGEVTVFDTVTGETIGRLAPPGDAIGYLDAGYFGPDNDLIATGPSAGVVRVDREARNLEKTTRISPTGGRAIAVDPTGTSIAILEGQSIRLMDTEGRPIAKLEGHAGVIHHGEFSSDGRYLLSAASDQTVRVWEVSRRRATAVLVGHTASVHMAAMSDDGKSVVSYASDGLLKIWSTGGDELPSLNTAAGNEWTPGVAFGPNGRWLVSGSGDGQIVTWDLGSGRRLNTSKLDASVMAIALNRDGTLLAVGTDNRQELRLLDPLSGEVRRRVRPGECVLTVEFSPDGRLLLATGENGSAAVFNVETGDLVGRYSGLQGSVMAAAFSPRGDLIASSGNDGRIHLWRPDGTPVRRFASHQSQVSCLAFSPNGDQLAAANQVRDRQHVEPVIKIWDVAGGALQRELKGHDQSIWCLAYTPDGSRLASGSEDKSIKIWEANQGEWLLTLKGPRDDIRCLTFSPNGRILAASGDDNLIRLWDAAPIGGDAAIRLSR